MTIANVWILVCDASHARLLETHGRVHVWKSVREFRRGELSDDEFARLLAGVLAQGRLWKRFCKLVVAAPSPFLGRLRSAMTAQVADEMLAAFDANYLDVPVRDLPARLVAAFHQKNARPSHAAPSSRRSSLPPPPRTERLSA